jgi:hypothetical protein
MKPLIPNRYAMEINIKMLFYSSSLQDEKKKYIWSSVSCGKNVRGSEVQELSHL